MSKMKELYLKVAADAGLQEKANKIFEATEDGAAIAAKLVAADLLFSGCVDCL